MLRTTVDGASRTLSVTVATFTGVRSVFGLSLFGLSMRMPVSFTFVSQDNEQTELMVLFFFQNPYATFTHILQLCHDFRSLAAIFNSIVQAYTQPYLFRGRIKLIICHIRHELSVTIHEVSTSCKKTKVGWWTQYYGCDKKKFAYSKACVICIR